MPKMRGIGFIKQLQNYIVVPLCCGAVGLMLPVKGATYYWDVDPDTAQNQNGSGVWTTSDGNKNWSQDGTGPSQPWVNGNHTAQLGATSLYSNNGVGGTITLGENIQLYRIAKSANAGNYVIEGNGFTLELVGTNPGFGNNNVSSGGELVINAEVIGTKGLEKTHNGTVILSQNNSYSGGTVIGTTQTSSNSSTLQIGNGGTTGSLGSGDVTFKSNGATSGQSVLSFKRSDVVTLTQNLISDSINPNKGILRQAGTGTLVVAGENTQFVGKVEVTSGILQVGDGATAGSLGGVTGVSVSSGGVLKFNRSDDVSFAAPVSGAGKVLKSGANTLTWNASGSTFSGGLDLEQGTFQLGGADVLPSTTTVNFIGNATLDLANFDQTLGNFTLADGVTGYVIGTGKLTMGANNVVLGPNDLTSVSALDLTGLAEFEFNGSNRSLTVGGRLGSNDAANTTATGVLKLAQHNVILASAVNVGTLDGGGNAHKNAGALYLGQYNAITAGSLNIGTANKNSGIVTFADGITDGELILRGTAANQRINIFIGRHNSNVIEPAESMLDMTGGTVDALVGDLVMGSSISGSTSSRARLRMGEGTFDVENVVLGRREAGSINGNQPYGIFELNGGTVLAKTITFADNQPDSATGNVQGIFNLLSGTLKVQTMKAGSGTNNVTRRLNWMSGLLTNYDAATDSDFSGIDIRLEGDGSGRELRVDPGRQIVVSSNIINGSVAPTATQTAFRKTGTGTLVLSGLNTHSGITDLAEGMIRIAANNVLSNNSTIHFSGNTTLDLQGFTDEIRDVTIGNGVTGKVIGSGKLLMGSNNVLVGPNDRTSISTLDLSELAEFEFNGTNRTLTVGGTTFTSDAGDTTATGIMRLAQTNVIKALAVNVGTTNAGGNAHKNAGELYLGQYNEITAGSLNIGTAIKNSGKVAFDNGITDGTLILRGTAANQRINIFIGRHESNVTEPAESVMDLTGGTVDALVGELVMGSSTSGSRSSRAKLIMGLGTFDVENVVLGRREAVSVNANQPYGIFDLNGGTVVAKTITFADNLPTTPANRDVGNVQGIFNLNSGKLRAQTLQAGAGESNVTRELNWKDGTIENYDSSTDLSISGVLLKLVGDGTRDFRVSAGRMATIHSTIIDASGANQIAFTKTGSGILMLLEANEYSGKTTVAEGTLVANNVSGSATGFGAVTVESGATLAGNGRLAPKGSAGIEVHGTLKIGDPLQIMANALVVDLSETSGGFALDGVMSFDLFTNAGDNSAVLTASDRLILTGADASDLAWNGTLHLGLNGMSMLGTISEGDRWLLVDWSDMTGGLPAPMFSSIDASEIALAPNLQFTVETDAQGLYAVVSAVPEPSRWLLVMVGFAMMLGHRRRNGFV